MKPQTDDARDLSEKAESMTAKLVAAVNSYTSDRNRIRGLVLLEARGGEGGHKRARSRVFPYDRPEIELIIHHSDRAARIEYLITNAEIAIESAKKQIEEEPSYIQAMGVALAELVRLENQRMRHISAIEDALATLAKECAATETIMARLAADAAHLSQKASEHHDKMDLARKTSSIPSSSDLKQRLALKYNVPVEQVEALLAAKQVDVEPD